MPCHADRSVQLLIRRELQRRVDGLKAIAHAHMAGWAAQNRMPGPRAMASTALSAGIQEAIGSAAETAFSWAFSLSRGRMRSAMTTSRGSIIAYCSVAWTRSRRGSSQSKNSACCTSPKACSAAS